MVWNAPEERKGVYVRVHRLSRFSAQFWQLVVSCFPVWYAPTQQSLLTSTLVIFHLSRKPTKQNSKRHCCQSMETVIDLCSSSSDGEEEEKLGVGKKHCTVMAGATFASASSVEPTSTDNNVTLSRRNDPLRNSLDIMSYSSTTSYKCVICGVSLQHIPTLNGRVLHLKQCSKKHGIQARDLCRKDGSDDHDEITNDEQEREKSSFHTESTTTNAQAKSISAYFNNDKESSKPPRTLNTILMDNARRLAKCNNIIKKNLPGNKGAVPQKKTTTWKRRPFQVRTMA